MERAGDQGDDRVAFRPTPERTSFDRVPLLETVSADSR
jgi:hypothetical protein